MKKFLSIVMALALVCALGTSALAETITLKVWGAQEDQAMLGEMIESFKAQYPDKDFDITLGVVGEPDARARYTEDPAAAADVFAFINDQLYDLVNADALYEVTRNKDEIIAANVGGSIESATIGDTLYAYPMTADNGYFLYYDTSVITDASTLDGILEQCAAAGKSFFMDVSNGWYIASFFLGAGCTIGLDEDGNQVCDFNNEKGLAAAEAIKALTANSAFMTGDANSILPGGIGDTIAAGVCGTWVADAVMEKLGDNYAAAKLPTFTCDGEQVQMASFGGYKLVGVSSQTDYPVEAMDLAEWLTNEENQVIRFEKRLMGPSNINAAKSETVQANVALAALSAQSEYAISQRDVLGYYWTPAEAFGLTMEAKDYSKDTQTVLDEMVAQIIAK